MRLVHFTFLLLLCNIGLAQTKEHRRGAVIDSILVSGTQHETFALYLPGEYDPQSLSAIVFIFDPAARGAWGIKPFIAAAERYNYILVCSNNAKNGPYEPNLAVTERLFNHVLSKFNIAEKRIYTAGFSGGSRLAASIAVLSNAMQGVIGCGAGFSGNLIHTPSNKNTFSYVGLVGDRDMNYQEMLKAGRWLNTMNIDNEIFTYEDDHNWPPPEQLVRAFNWLELQAFKKGLKAEDPGVIDNIYLEEYKLGHSLEKAGKIYKAVEEYERIERNFSKAFELDSLAERIKKLKKTRSYKDATRDRKQVARLEDTLTSRYSAKFMKEEALAKSSDDFKWWKKQLKKLDESFIDSDSEYLQKMGRRLRYNLFALAIESFSGHVREKQVDKARYCSQLLLVQGPDNPFFHYRLALGFAELELKEASLFHMEAALANGWKQTEAFRKARQLRSLQNDPRFKSILKKFEE